MSALQAVLFDLDGTLIDTAGDLLGALDDLRAELGLAACAATLPPAVAARGGRGIISLGFPEDPQAADRYLPRYLELYRLRIAKLSRPYAGIESMLQALHERGIALGIVTNKPEGLARDLLAELSWECRSQESGAPAPLPREGGAPAPLMFAEPARSPSGPEPPSRRLALPGAHALVLVGGDTLPVRKPAPDPIWLACKLLDVDPVRSIMVGDDRRDIASGRAAGCALSIAVSYGYIENPAELASWKADHIVDTPEALAELLLALTQSQ